MYEDDEEIYDDTTEEMAEPTGLSAIRSRFEQASAKFEKDSKPVPTPKPKFGGGVGLSIVGNKKEDVAPGVIKPAVRRDSDTEPVGSKKRDSITIPSAFLKTTDSPTTEAKPKPIVKPKWGSDSNNNASVNGVAPVGKEEIEKTWGKKPVGGVGAKPPSVPSTGKVSPRDTGIPNDQSQTGPAKVISPLGIGGGISIKPSDLKAHLKHVEKPQSKTPVSPKPKIEEPTEPIAWRKQLRSAAERETVSKNRISVRCMIRTSDGKKFNKVLKSSLDKDVAKAPDKPEKMDIDIDLESLEKDYQEVKEQFDQAEKKDHGWTEVEELYDDCGNIQDSRVISFIEPMTEEEERIDDSEWSKHGFTGLQDDLPAPPPELLEESYDDVAVALKDKAPAPDGDDDDGEMYEELPEDPIEPPPPPGPKPSDQPPDIPPSPLPKTPQDREGSDGSLTSSQSTDKQDKIDKQKEKERKKKEKEEKKLQKQREEELKKTCKLFKISDPTILTKSIGNGKVKAAAKENKKKGDLGVFEGEEVEIVRMVDNPSGKWLVRLVSTQKVGYVDEKNIEVDTSIIQSVMKGGAQQNGPALTADGEVQETYEDVEGIVEPIEEDIYEECT